MSHTKRTKHTHAGTIKAEQHIAAARLSFVLLLFSMASLDGAYGERFNFSSELYLLVMCVILGLDVPKLLSLLIFRKR